MCKSQSIFRARQAPVNKTKRWQNQAPVSQRTGLNIFPLTSNSSTSQEYEIKIYQVPVMSIGIRCTMLSPRELRPMISASQNLPLLQRILPTLLLNTPRLGRRSYAAPTGSLPRVAQPSVWNSIVPKFLRESQNPGLPAKLKRSKDWNPATFYIVIFLLIGSNAIQMIALRHEYTAFSRKADAKIGLLKEVIERIQRGEDVDVAGLLGTGDEVKEKEWEDGMYPVLPRQALAFLSIHHTLLG